MAYQKKYYYTYVPTGTSETHLVELWQDTVDVVVAEEVDSGVPPFVVEMPELNHKFQPIRGKGCIINLLSDTDGKFFDGLYHVDMQEFMVLHYIDAVLNFSGYLNPEMYTEPYDQSENYIIQTSGNDGFSLMDRMFFNQSDFSVYSGLKTEWELIQIVLDEIALPYTDIRISLSTTFANFSGDADSTILHETFIDSSNFYDEDNKPMTLREVLRSVLEPYGAFIIQENGSIYITDVNTIAAGGSVTYQKFNATSYAYISDVVEPNEKTITSIGYLGTGQQIEISGGTNRQIVSYSPYPYKEIVNELLVTPEEFGTVPGSFSSKNGYNYRTLADHIFYDSGTFSDFEESFKQAGSEHFVYLRCPLTPAVTADNLTFKDVTSVFLNIETTRLANVVSSRPNSRRFLDGMSILITGSILTKSKTNPYDDAYLPAEIDLKKDQVNQLSINYIARLGGKYYNRATDTWLDTIVLDNYLSIAEGSGGTIGNKWVDFSHKMNLSYTTAEIILAGYFTFVLASPIKASINGGELIDDYSIIDEYWLRNLNFSIVNKDGSEVSDSDFEYIGELNKSFAEPGEKIELTSGTSSIFADRGKKIYHDGSNYHAIEEWTRNSQTYKIEELLLSSLTSNYLAGYVSLLNIKLKNSFNALNVLTDTFTGDRKFMVKSMSKDFHSNTNTVDLVEISEDDTTIVKE